MSRRAVTQPRKSTPKSDLTGKSSRNQTSLAEFGGVKRSKSNSRASMKRWDFGFHPVAMTTLNSNRTGLSSESDSVAQGYRKISEIKNRIQSTAYPFAAAFNLSNGSNAGSKFRLEKSFLLNDEINPTPGTDIAQQGFINRDAKLPARISDITETANSCEETGELKSRVIEPLINASALLSDLTVEEDKNATEVETIPDNETETVILETEEPLNTVDSTEKPDSEMVRPPKKALKLIRPPETIEDDNEEANKTDETEPVVEVDDDILDRKPEEIVGADGSDDDKDNQAIDSNLAIEFALQADEPVKEDKESKSEICTMEITFDLAKQLTEETIKVNPDSDAKEDSDSESEIPVVEEASNLTEVIPEETVEIEPDSSVEEDNELESDAPVMETASDLTEAIAEKTTDIEPDSSVEEDEEEQPQIQQELKSAEEGPRPEMHRPDLKRAQRSDSRPWSLDVEIALRDLMGDIANPMQVELEQMAAAWKRGFDTYFSTSLAETRFPYIWIDVQTVDKNDDGGAKRLVSLVGANLRGQLRLLALVEEDTENPEFWHEILRDLEKRDLANPRLFIGDNRLPLWQILGSVFPRAQIQYCRSALREQIMEHFQRDCRDEAGRLLEQIYQADSHRAALESVERFKLKYTDRFPCAVAELVKNRENLLTYFSFPRQHWCAIGQSGRIGNAYPSRALLATVFKYEKFRDFAAYLVFNYLLRTQRSWTRLKSARFLRRIQAGKAYVDGRRSRKHEPRGIILPKETRKRTGITGRISESVRSILSIFYKRPSSGNMPVFKDAGGKSVPIRMDAVRDKARPGKNLSSTKTAVGLTGNPKTVGSNSMRAIAKQTSKPVSLPAAAEHPSRLVSGLERELLEDLKKEKVAN